VDVAVAVEATGRVSVGGTEVIVAVGEISTLVVAQPVTNRILTSTSVPANHQRFDRYNPDMP
jgi:hypothetical protein